MVFGAKLAVCDFGLVNPIDSQALWHALAAGVTDPTLTFMRPNAAYVSLGMHRHSSEIDRAVLRGRGLPVFRRYVGGGPVYLDPNQLFFQIYLPKSMAIGTRSFLLTRLLSPAVDAFAALGVDAVLDRYGEISVGCRKLCGHGAGEIGSGIVVVGNCIERFDAPAAAKILNKPEPVRGRASRLMARFVGPAKPIRAGQVFIDRAVSAYCDLFGATTVTEIPGELYQDRLVEARARLTDPTFVDGVDLGLVPPGRLEVLKIRAGVLLLVGEEAEWLAVATVVFGDIEELAVTLPTCDLEGPEAFDFLRTVGPIGTAFLRRLNELEREGSAVLLRKEQTGGDEREEAE
jgi:lipoate-protein ligase A